MKTKNMTIAECEELLNYTIKKVADNGMDITNVQAPMITLKGLITYIDIIKNMGDKGQPYL